MLPPRARTPPPLRRSIARPSSCAAVPCPLAQPLAGRFRRPLLQLAVRPGVEGNPGGLQQSLCGPEQPRSATRLGHRREPLHAVGDVYPVRQLRGDHERSLEVPGRLLVFARRPGRAGQDLERRLGGQPVTRLLCEREGFLRVFGRPRIVATPEGRDRHVVQDVGGGPRVSLLPEVFEHFSEDPGRPVEISHLQHGEAHHPRRVRLPVPVPGLPEERGALLGYHHEPLGVPRAVHAHRQRVERPRLRSCRQVSAVRPSVCSISSRPSPCRARISQYMRNAQPNRAAVSHVSRLQRFADRGPQVVVLRLQSVEPLDLIPALHPRFRLLGEREEVPDVAQSRLPPRRSAQLL